MGTPHLEISIDPTSESSLQEGCLKVLKHVRPSWVENEIKTKMFTDGLTNKLVGGWKEGFKEDLVLVRVYGDKTEQYIDRGAEVENMKLLESGGNGAKLYATFQNGLAYEFVAGRVVEPGQQVPQVYREVARTLAQMHSIELPEGRRCPGVWSFLRRLASIYPSGELPGLLTKEELEKEIYLMESSLSNSSSPIVFSHNDAMPANMVVTNTGTVRLIDLEYSGPNYAAFDIANLFNEWIGFDLQNMDFVGNYPTEEKVEDWLTHYLTQFNGERPDMNTLKDLRAEVQRFSKVNHLVWSTWSVIQAVSSSIDYDYFEYARIRLGEYLKLKTEQ